MKIYKYIVINKNNMAYLEHFSSFSDLDDYLFPLAGEFLILVDEKDIVTIKKTKYQKFNEKTLTLVPHTV